MNEKASRRLATIVFWALILSLVLLPSFIPALAYSIGFNVACALLVLLSVGAWVHFDARVHGFTVGPLMRISIILFAYLAVPFYVFRSRGFQGGLFWLLKIVGALALLILLLGAISVATGVEPA
jgi:hypothetical protein